MISIGLPQRLVVVAAVLVTMIAFTRAAHRGSTPQRSIGGCPNWRHAVKSVNWMLGIDLRSPPVALTLRPEEVKTKYAAPSPRLRGVPTPCLHRSIFTEAWYQLWKAEQDDLWAKVEEIERRAGSNWQILCDSRWADEQVFDWGVLEYPDIYAYRLKVAELEKLNWWRYWSSYKTMLGTKWTGQAHRARVTT